MISWRRASASSWSRWAGSGMHGSWPKAPRTAIRASPHGAASNHPDHAAITEPLPGQTLHQRIELRSGQRQRALTLAPAKAPLVQTTTGQPDALSIVDQHLHSRSEPHNIRHTDQSLSRSNTVGTHCTVNVSGCSAALGGEATKSSISRRVSDCLVSCLRGWSTLRYAYRP